MSHTPGPWKVYEGGKAALIPGLPPTFEIISEGYTEGQDSACWVAQVQATIHGEANAELIAASPDLLEALERSKTLNPWSEEWQGIRDAAIAKAKGGAA